MLIGVSLMLVVTFIWGSGFIIAHLVDLPSPVYVFYRFLFAVPFITALAIKKGMKRPDWRVIATGFFMAANWIFLFWAIKFIDIASADLIYYTGPVMALVLSPLVLKVRNPWWTWIAVALSMTGVSLMYGISDDLNLTGITLAFTGGMFYALLILFGKILSSEYHPSVVTAYQMIVGLILTTPFAVLMDYSLNPFKLVLLVIAGVVVSALSIFLWLSAMRYLSVRVVSIMAYLDPLFAALLAFLILGQEVDLGTVIGGLAIIGAGVLTILMENREAVS